MPVLCSPDDLAEEIACLAAQNRQTLLAEIVWLLCRIKGMSCTPDTLADDDDIRCLSNWNEGMLLASAVKKLCEIANGGSLATCIVCGEGDASGTPPCDCSLYVNTLNANLWGSSDGATWFPIIYGP